MTQLRISRPPMVPSRTGYTDSRGFGQDTQVAAESYEYTVCRYSYISTIEMS